MMKKMIRILMIMICTGAISFALAQSNSNQAGQEVGDELNTITTSVPFLMIAPDARAGGMGDAGVATSADANSIHWNPAKLAFSKKDMGVGISFSPWLRGLVDDIYLGYISGFKRVDDMQTIGGSLLYFSLGNIIFTDEQGNTTGQFKPNEFAIDLAYSRKLGDNISGGLAVRYIHSNLTGGQFLSGSRQRTKPGNAIAVDVSAFYEKEIEMKSMRGNVLTVGLNISNMGNKISYTETTERDFLPINLRFGPAFFMELDKYNTLLATFDINKLLVPTPPVYKLDSAGNPEYINNERVVEFGKDPNVSVVSGMFQSFNDAPLGFKEEMRELTYSVGVEYWYDKQFAIRAGYFYEHATKGNRKFFTLGAGLKYSVFGLDLAYLVPTEQRHPLENTLRFSLIFDFDAFKEQNK